MGTTAHNASTLQEGQQQLYSVILEVHEQPLSTDIVTETPFFVNSDATR